MQIKENISLRELTTMRVGGPARFFAYAETEEEVKDTLRYAQAKDLPLFVLGEGSNIVVGDKGFPGVVLKLQRKGIQIVREHGETVEIKACAGEHWDDVVRFAVFKNLYGIENLSLIPGTLGAAPVQNIGAYGQEIKNVISWVKVLNAETGRVETLSNKECGFTYRDSIFKQKGGENLIILEVGLCLKTNGELNIGYRDVETYFKEKKIEFSLETLRDAVIEIRTQKLPDIARYGSVGSFFKNSIVSKEKYNLLVETYPTLPGFVLGKGSFKVPLAWVLDHLCDAKEARHNAIGVYPRQSLVIVNYGGGTAEEVKFFAEFLRKKVYEKIQILPEYEIQFVGEF